MCLTNSRRLQLLTLLGWMGVCWAQNWPGFRGDNAAGIGDGNPPVAWNGETGQGVAWKTPLPGLAHSSPVVWGELLFVTTAVSRQDGPLELAVESGRRVVDDSREHSFQLLCLDADSGEVLWTRTAQRAVPRIKRHVKASYANASPATDGRYVVAFFGSQGLYCYDFQGRLLWKQNLGVLDAGYVGRPEFQWGTASSPILYQDLVIVQCDSRNGSFLAAFELAGGKQAWRSERDENPSWATPVAYRGESRTELITSSPRYFRGYDPRTGRELWRFFDGADVKVPTPVVGEGLIYFAGGAPKGRQFTALRPGGSGDISSAQDEAGRPYLAWQVKRGGPYTPTPILYRGCFYVLGDNGVLSGYDPASGRRLFQQRVPERGANFSASPVAAAGRLYLAGEDGEVHVVRVGAEFEILASNPMGESLMATPALSGGRIYIRGRHHLFAVY